MTLRLALVGLAAVTLTVAGISIAPRPAHAFTFESGTNADGSAKFADPDDQVNNLGSSGLHIGGGTVQSGAGQTSPTMPMSPFNHFQGAGFQGNGNAVPPQPYAMPLGNGN